MVSSHTATAVSYRRVQGAGRRTKVLLWAAQLQDAAVNSLASCLQQAPEEALVVSSRTATAVSRGIPSCMSLQRCCCALHSCRTLLGTAPHSADSRHWWTHGELYNAYWLHVCLPRCVHERERQHQRQRQCQHERQRERERECVHMPVCVCVVWHM